MEKAEVPNIFCTAALSSKSGLQEPRVPETKGKIWSKEDVPLVEEDQVREYLGKLDLHKSMGPDGKQPQVLRQQGDVITRPLLIIFD